MDINLQVEAEKAALRARLAELDGIVVKPTSADEAKKALSYDEKTGWGEPMEEDEIYAKALGTQACLKKDGKIIARLRTPRIIALERVARGEAPLEVPRVEFSIRPPTTSSDSGAQAERRAGPKGRQILILEIGAAYEGILKATEDYSFESAAEAARLLEVTPAFLSQEFKKAAGKPITIRGVTIQYLDLYVADDTQFRD